MGVAAALALATGVGVARGVADGDDSAVAVGEGVGVGVGTLRPTVGSMGFRLDRKRPMTTAAMIVPMTAPIASATSVEQVGELLGAAEIALNPDDLKALDTASAWK